MIGLFAAAALFASGGAACFATTHEVAAGSALRGEDVTQVDCSAAAPRAALRYDRAAGAPVAARTLEALESTSSPA